MDCVAASVRVLIWVCVSLEDRLGCWGTVFTPASCETLVFVSSCGVVFGLLADTSVQLNGFMEPFSAYSCRVLRKYCRYIFLPFFSQKNQNCEHFFHRILSAHQNQKKIKIPCKNTKISQKRVNPNSIIMSQFDKKQQLLKNLTALLENENALHSVTVRRAIELEIVKLSSEIRNEARQKSLQTDESAMEHQSDSFTYCTIS